MTRTRLAAALASLLVATTAAAESPRRGHFELGGGPYEPNVDEGLPSPGPYEEVFGSRGIMFRAGIAYTLLFAGGPLDVGFRSGFFRKNGKGMVQPGGATFVRSDDDTAFNIIPTSLTLTYRFDGIADRVRWFPFAPYARVALERYNWWASNGEGDTQGHGATNGWSYTAGVAFRLDALDAQSGRELDSEFGLNHAHLFFDVTKTVVDDFGSSSSWDLSDTRWSMAGGLLFSF